MSWLCERPGMQSQRSMVLAVFVLQVLVGRSEAELIEGIDVSHWQGYIKWIRDFNTVVENRLGFTSLIYANSNYANNYFEADLAQYDFWLAN